MNFTEKRQPVVLASAVKDMLTGETLAGEVTLEKYEARIAVKAKE